jgi:hypothetical protein
MNLSKKWTNFQHIRTGLSKKLNKRILKVTEAVEDFADHLDAKHPKQALNFALDLLKPYLQALGLRIAKLSEEQVEVIMPEKVLFQNSEHEHDEGAIVTAALFAYKTLWSKNAPKGNFQVQIKKVELEKVRAATGDLHIKILMSKLAREAVFADLADHNSATQEIQLQIYDINKQVVAQVQVSAMLKLAVSLDWK